jgi:hypothetical protein
MSGLPPLFRKNVAFPAFSGGESGNVHFIAVVSACYQDSSVPVFWKNCPWKGLGRPQRRKK